MKAKIKSTGSIHEVFCFRPGYVCLLVDGRQQWFTDSDVEIVQLYAVVRFSVEDSTDFGFVYNSIKTDDESKQFHFCSLDEAEQARQELQSMNGEQHYQIAKLDWL